MTDHIFASLWDLGYRSLLPIIPPSAEISVNSSLFKRIGTKQDARGKVPGIKGNHGRWFSFDWLRHTTTDADLDKWADMGAGLGIRTGNGLLAIDADTLDLACAMAIEKVVRQHFGETPIRIGRHPKALYLIATSEEILYQRIDFNEPDEHGNQERVELLTGKQQFVAHGIHPKTGNPYKWISPLVPVDQLPVANNEQIAAFMADLAAVLPQASQLKSEGSAAEYNQKDFIGSVEHVRKAVEAIPNSSTHFATREDYLAIGYAIKAALPDDEYEAFEIFSDWCDKWQEGNNHPDIVAADWRRMKPPYKRGADWLYQTAERLSAGSSNSFTEAEAWFDILPEEPENVFDFLERQEAKANTQNELYPLLRIGDIISRPPPTYLIARHIAEQSVGFIYSRPGAGKTFLALDMALSVAFNQSAWFTDEIRTPASAAVLYIASEGSFGFRNRIAAWMKKSFDPAANNPEEHFFEDLDNPENNSAKSLPKTPEDNFYMIERTINFMDKEDVSKLIRSVQAVQSSAGVQFCLIVIDTVSRAMPGADENLQKDMTRFVQACDLVKDTFKAAVIGVHHAGKTGDMRGSTVLRGAGDFVFRLERKEGSSFGRLYCEKQKDAPDGWSEPYVFNKVSLDGSETSLVVARAEAGYGEAETELTPESADKVLAAMQAAWDSGEPWSMAANSPARAVRAMVRDFGFDAYAAEEVLDLWLKTGHIVSTVFDKKTKRKGLHVASKVGVETQQGSIFD